MNEPLRPSSFGEILDRAIQLYRSRFSVYLGIAILPAGTQLFLALGSVLFLSWFGSPRETPLDPAMASVAALGYFAALVLIGAPLGLATASLGSAALTNAANSSWQGKKITIAGSLKSVWKTGWRYILLQLLVSLFLFIAPNVVLSLVGIPLLVVSTLHWAGDANPVVVLGGGVLLSGYFLWMRLRLALAFPASVAEQTGAWKAIKRGNRLSKGSRGRLLLLYLLHMVLSWVLTIGFSLPALIGLAMIPGANSPQHTTKTGGIAICILVAAYYAVQALVRPVTAIALMLTYYDQRIRQEAFDIEWLMQQAGLTAESRPVEPPPAPQAAPWLTPIATGPKPAIAEDRPTLNEQVEPRASATQESLAPPESPHGELA